MNKSIGSKMRIGKRGHVKVIGRGDVESRFWKRAINGKLFEFSIHQLSDKALIIVAEIMIFDEEDVRHKIEIIY